MAAIKVCGHVCWTGAEVTVQKVCEEQPGEDESVISLPFVPPLGVDLSDSLIVISDDVVAPKFICSEQKSQAFFDVAIDGVEEELFIGVQILGSNAVDSCETTE